MALRRGFQPSSVRRAGRVHDRHAEREVDPPRRRRLQAQPPREVRRGAQDAGAQRHGRAPSSSPSTWGSMTGSAATLNAPRTSRARREAVGLADVEGVHRLEAQARDVGHHADELLAQQRAGQERPGEQAPDARGGLALEDQPGAQADDAHPGVLALEDVQQPLALRLVARVEEARDAGRGPRLVDRAVLRAGRVRADRGGVHERLDLGAGGGLEHPAAPVDVDRVQLPVVARGLDEPRQVDHGVGPAEQTARSS